MNYRLTLERVDDYGRVSNAITIGHPVYPCRVGVAIADALEWLSKDRHFHSKDSPAAILLAAAEELGLEDLIVPDE